MISEEMVDKAWESYLSTNKIRSALEAVEPMILDKAELACYRLKHEDNDPAWNYACDAVASAIRALVTQ